MSTFFPSRSLYILFPCPQWLLLTARYPGTLSSQVLSLASSLAHPLHFNWSVPSPWSVPWAQRLWKVPFFLCTQSIPYLISTCHTVSSFTFLNHPLDSQKSKNRDYGCLNKIIIIVYITKHLHATDCAKCLRWHISFNLHRPHQHSLTTVKSQKKNQGLERRVWSNWQNQRKNSTTKLWLGIREALGIQDCICKVLSSRRCTSNGYHMRMSQYFMEEGEIFLQRKFFSALLRFDK